MYTNSAILHTEHKYFCTKFRQVPCEGKRNYNMLKQVETTDGQRNNETQVLDNQNPSNKLK